MLVGRSCLLGIRVSAMLVPAGVRCGWALRTRGLVLAGLLLCGMAWGQEAKPRAADGSAPVVSEKQKKLIEDSEKLVQMAAELKVSVDKSSKNELSMDVVRKAEAVEKLAKSIKERIREAR